MAPNIVVVGSINMDLVVRSPRHPQPGETLIGGPFATVPGGKGANQAVAAARMGGQVTLIGCVGDDVFGRESRAGLAAAGVNTARVATVAGATGVALITVSAAGENTIIVAPGANAMLSAEMVAAAGDAIATADVLLLQLEVPIEIMAAAAELASRHGVPVVLNPAPAQGLPGGLMQHVAYLVPNEHEAALLTGQSITGIVTAQRAAKRLHEMGAAQVVLTLGSMGAVVLAEGSVTHVPAFRVRRQDSTAAGDAFLGAFAVALTEGCTTPEAVRWGCAAGALACTALGAQPSLPARAAVEKMLHAA